MNEAPTTSLRQIPFLDQYFGFWAMLEDRFTAGFEQLRRMNLSLHMQEVQAASGGSGAKGSYSYETPRNGIVVLDVAGTLMKQQSSATASTSTVMMRRTLRQARADDMVAGVMLRIDSPGGTVAGNQDLAEDIAALAAVKPVAAYVEDLCASAAYWLAAMCPTISANKGLIGSIGTYGIVYDMSAAAAMEGVQVHVIRAGAFKGAGVPGTKVDQAQLAETQRIVDSLNAEFVGAVAKGRNMPLAKAQQIADGRIHPAADALKMGLIDHIESFDAAMSRLNAAIRNPAPRRAIAAQSTVDQLTAQDVSPNLSTEQQPGATVAGNDDSQAEAAIRDVPDASGADANTAAGDDSPEKGSDMTQNASAPGGASTATEPKPASIAELKAAFPKDPAFALDAAEKAFTITEAKAAYSDVLQGRLDEQQAKASAAPAAAADPAPIVTKKPGVPALDSAAAERRSASSAGGANATGDAVADFNAAVESQMKKPGFETNRKKAVAAVCRSSPELHEAYVLANNPGRQQQQMVADRFTRA